MPDFAKAMALIDYLTQPETQITLARTVGFSPVVSRRLPPDLDPGLKMGTSAIAEMLSAKDALPTLPPIGLGQHDAEFDRVFFETFQLIVLRGQKPRPVLDREAAILKRPAQIEPKAAGARQIQRILTRLLRLTHRRAFRSSSLWQLTGLNRKRSSTRLRTASLTSIVVPYTLFSPSRRAARFTLLPSTV